MVKYLGQGILRVMTTVAVAIVQFCPFDELTSYY